MDAEAAKPGRLVGFAEIQTLVMQCIKVNKISSITPPTNGQFPVRAENLVNFRLKKKMLLGVRLSTGNHATTKRRRRMSKILSNIVERA